MAKYKIIAADLDGTILDDTYRVMPELLAALDKAREKETELVLATGRLYPSALPLARELGVKMPVIASNGAVVKDPATDELLFYLPMAMELALEALRLTKSDTAQRFVNIRDKFYTDASEENSQKYSEALRIDFVRRVPLEEAVTEDPIMVVVRDRAEEIARMTSILRRHFGDRLYLANSKPIFIDINHPGVSKGTALLRFCEQAGIDPSQVIAIGDGWNDVEMFKVAGLGAAVANAPDGVKAKADYICTESSYKGVVEIINKFVLGAL